MEKKLNLKNLKKRVDKAIEMVVLPDTPEMRQKIEDLFLGRTDRYTAKELDNIDHELATRILGHEAAESAMKGVEFHYDTPEKEENIMFG